MTTKSDVIEYIEEIEIDQRLLIKSRDRYLSALREIQQIGIRDFPDAADAILMAKIAERALNGRELRRKK